MKRLGMAVAAVAVILMSAMPAKAQQQSFTVTFGGQMRVYGLVWDNMTDFTDTGKNSTAFGTLIGGAKDSEAYYFQRWRLYTTVESADKNAKVVWAIEVGDITWGLGGGASGAEYGGGGARTGPSQGGGLGNDGVNVETKNLYLQFNIPWVPGANILLGAHNIVFMASPAGGFMDDDGAGIQFNWKMDPVDLQLYTVKTDENTRASADDNTMYAARLGVNVTPDTRVTAEFLTVDQQCFARRAAPAGSPAGTVGSCVSADLGDTWWGGLTAGTKIAGITLHGSFVYGQRQLFSATNQNLVEESGWGLQFVGQVPLGPLATWWQAWYTSGDKARPTGGGCADVTVHPACGKLIQGLDFSTQANSTNLLGDSDKLPIPITGASWGNVPFVAEFLRGMFLVGAPGFGSTHYADATGTWGIGGSATYALTPAFSLGGGVAFLAATEDSQGCVVTGLPGGPVSTRCGGGVYGDNAIEIDGGVIWRYNPNLTITGLAGYVVPDEGDDAWGVTFRTQFSF
ncbi:MAG: hypothetical protein HY359_18010 [Candidatus Rokubacteria bacterium]|nr:hypothetical protein [Candidatus Rokubacteria bacterium]